MVHIPYPSSPAAMTALIRGDVQMAALPAISVTPQAEASKAKILAVSLPKRSPLPAEYSDAEGSGIDVEADTWMGLIAPGRHAAGAHQRDPQGRGGSDHVQGIAGKTGDAIDGAGRQFAGAISHGDRQRNHPLGTDHQGWRRKD